MRLFYSVPWMKSARPSVQSDTSGIPQMKSSPRQQWRSLTPRHISTMFGKEFCWSSEKTSLQIAEIGEEVLSRPWFLHQAFHILANKQSHWVIKLQSQTLPNLQDTLGHQDLAHFLWEKNDRSSSAKEQCRTRFPRQFCLPILPCWFREFQIRLSAIPATYRHQLNCWCASISETTALLVRLNAATSSFPLISKSHTCNDSGVDVSNFDKAAVL